MRKLIKKSLAVLLAVLLMVPSVTGLSAFADSLYEQTYYIVTYILDGEEYTAQAYHYGDTIVFPELTVNTGYTFSGWSDKDGTIYDETSVILGDTQLFGSLTLNDYTLTYIVNGEIYKTQTAHYNDMLAYVTHPVETGYSFAGWYADAGCTEAAPAVMPDGDLTVYGKYTQNHYTISYFVDGVDTALKQENYAYGDTIEPLRNYDEIEGMTFSGWYLDSALTESIPETMPDNDLIFYGKLTPNKYVLTYYLNGGYHTSQTYEYNQPITYLAYVPQEGFTFSDWLLADGAYKPLRMPAHNVTVYGTVTKVSAANVNGGTYGSVTVGDSVEVTVSLDAPFLTGLTISDFVFDDDVFMLDSIEWLCGGTQEIDLGNRVASVVFDENTDLDGDVLTLTFVVLSNAEVGEYDISFSAAATTDMGIGPVDVNTVVTPAKVQIICAAHEFAGGRIVANKNNTHSLYCANGCGVSINQSCDGGTATCLQKAVCSVCEAQYGQKLAHNYSGLPRGNGDGTHSYRCVSGCGEYGKDKIGCTYGVALNNGDNTSHKLSCTVCGESKNENCYGGTVTCLTVATCERCGVAYGDVLPHSYTGNVRNNYNGTHDSLCVNGCDLYGGRTDCEYACTNKTAGVHTKTCTLCNYTIDEYCSGGKASCLAPANCAFCEAAYGEPVAHSYTGEARNNEDGTHALQCVNGCGEYGEAVACTPDTFVSDGDATHSAACTVCEAVLHGDCTGGTATCAEYAKCDVCNGAYGELLNHDYSGVLAPNGDGTHSRLCVNGCDQTGSDVQTCTFSDWVGDGISAHTKTCSECKDQISENCTGGTATCIEKAVCAVCASEYGELLAHTFPQGAQGQAVSNSNGTHKCFCTACEQDVVLPCDYSCIPNQNGTHIAICKSCNYTVTDQPCSGGTATCLAAAVCEGCLASYGDPLKHDYSGSAKDNGNGTHCLQCVNGCEQFGGEKITCRPDTFVSNENDTHSAPCLDCGATLTQNCSGGVASCEKQAVCDYCGSGYGKGGDHSFETAHDDTHHWGVCSGCGKTTPADEHTFTAWTIITQATPQTTGLRRRLCTTCGAVYIETLPRLFAMGDVDFDGQITAGDARLVLRASVGLETLSAAAVASADVEKDGAVTAGDARLLLRASVSLEDASAWGNIGLDNEGNVIS